MKGQAEYLPFFKFFSHHFPAPQFCVHAASGGMNGREMQAIESPAPPAATRTTQWSGNFFRISRISLRSHVILQK